MKKRVEYNIRCEDETRKEILKELIHEEKKAGEKVSETIIRIFETYKKIK